MRSYTNRQVPGNDGHTDHVNHGLRRGEELQVYNSRSVKVRQTTRGWYLKANLRPPAPGSFRWQTPNKEIDPSLAVQKDTFVYITAGNVLVTTGMTDIVSNANVISCEGFWQAAQIVPAAVGGKYNVPVFPYPSATGNPTGAPGNVMGDLDNPAIFWLYWGQVACS